MCDLKTVAGYLWYGGWALLALVVCAVAIAAIDIGLFIHRVMRAYRKRK